VFVVFFMIATFFDLCATNSSEEDGTVTDYNDNRAKRRKIARLPDLLSGPTIPKFCSTQR